MVPKQSTSRVMYECFIIFNTNLNQTTGTEKAFPGMPSGFYSGMCSDSPYQQGRLPPLCTTRGGVGTEPTGKLAPTSPTGQTAFHWLWTHRATQEGGISLPGKLLPSPRLACWPEQPSLHAGLGSRTQEAELSQKETDGTTPLHAFLFPNSKDHRGRFAAP